MQQLELQAVNNYEVKWLTGEEYYNILQECKECLKINTHPKYPLEDIHPLWIYDQPQNGVFYFYKNKELLAFGFPRIQGQRKIYKWKKMNFTTILPKHNPKVVYIVATGRSRERCFRMHIVKQYNDYLNETNTNIVHQDYNDIVLCHMLEIEPQSFLVDEQGFRKRKIPKPIKKLEMDNQQTIKQKNILKLQEKQQQYQFWQPSQNINNTIKKTPNNNINLNNNNNEVKLENEDQQSQNNNNQNYTKKKKKDSTITVVYKDKVSLFDSEDYIDSFLILDQPQQQQNQNQKQYIVKKENDSIEEEISNYFHNTEYQTPQKLLESPINLNYNNNNNYNCKKIEENLTKNDKKQSNTEEYNTSNLEQEDEENQDFISTIKKLQITQSQNEIKNNIPYKIIQFDQESTNINTSLLHPIQSLPQSPQNKQIQNNTDNLNNNKEKKFLEKQEQLIKKHQQKKLEKNYNNINYNKENFQPFKVLKNIQRKENSDNIKPTKQQQQFQIQNSKINPIQFQYFQDYQNQGLNPLKFI